MITDFNTGEGQNIDDGDPANNDFIDLDPFYDNIFEARADLADDGILNQSNTLDAKGRSVDYGDNTSLPGTVELQGVAPSGLTTDNTSLICFAQGALIRTPQGDVRIEDLRPDDLVDTLDNGLQPVRWIGRRTVPGRGCFAPILIRKGVFGATSDLLVSPQHRILLNHPRAAILVGEDEVLAPAKHLSAHDGVSVSECHEVTYFHLLLDRHEIIFANGVTSESLHPGAEAMDGLAQNAREEILSLFPELAITPSSYGAMARMVLKGFEADLMAQQNSG